MMRDEFDELDEVDEFDEPGGLEVAMVHFRYQKAILTDGREVPVTHWFDGRGSKCKPREAVTCVCGSDEAGWFAVDLEAFGPATLH
jgi:hypothetical protein